MGYGNLDIEVKDEKKYSHFTHHFPFSHFPFRTSQYPTSYKINKTPITVNNIPMPRAAIVFSTAPALVVGYFATTDVGTGDDEGAGTFVGCTTVGVGTDIVGVTDDVGTGALVGPVPPIVIDKESNGHLTISLESDA